MDLMLKNMLEQLGVLTQCGGIRSYYDVEAPSEYAYKDSPTVFNFLSCCEEVAYSLKEEDVVAAEDLITGFCASTLMSDDFDNYKIPWMGKIVKLCLEYLMCDGLADATRASEIPDEIVDIVMKL